MQNLMLIIRDSDCLTSCRLREKQLRQRGADEISLWEFLSIPNKILAGAIVRVNGIQTVEGLFDSTQSEG